MKTNPGGQIAPENAIGRDALIHDIWEALEQQSVIMTAERRIGKTTILNKMQAESPTSWVPLFQDLEGFSSAADFASSVYKTVAQHLSLTKKSARRANELLKGLGGVQIGNIITLPKRESARWQDVLSNSVEDLVTEQSQDKRLLFLWDEMPYMLANIRDGEGEATAVQILNVLRKLRQTHQGFRMLVTGSIGLHHVLSSFKKKAGAGAAVNDMYAIDVSPLEPTYAQELATQLVRGEGLDVSNVDALALEIAQVADGFPFYIHHIVKALRSKNGTIEPRDVEGVVEEQLTDANDPWGLRHYINRLTDYYGLEKGTVLYLLDELSLREEPATARALLAHLQGLGDYDDLERLKNLLTQLAQDHYLLRSSDGYRFRFPLIQRWWKLERDLTNGAA